MFAAANKYSIFYGYSNFTKSHFIIYLLSIKMLHFAHTFFKADNILKACQNGSAGFSCKQKGPSESQVGKDVSGMRVLRPCRGSQI